MHHKPLQTGIGIRETADADFDDVLRLNLESEAVLSPLTPPRLRALIAQSWHHRVACLDGSVQAFLIALLPGADYDSPNYRWFADRYDEFVYVDRVVVAASARHARLATVLYEDLFRRARESGIARVTCEIDIEPPNPASHRFHAKLGFVEVGTQSVAGGKKRVSLQELRLGPRCG
jgi:predicted GNAT superfamily acetyltransferase